MKGRHSWPTKPTATLLDPGAAAGDMFGYSVAVNAEDPPSSRDHRSADNDGSGAIIVGAAGTYPSNGTAYIYTKRDEHKWPTTPAVTLADPPATAGDFFGSSVALSADTAVVGALNGNAAYIYAKGHEGKWPTTPTTSLADPASTPGDQFGNAVAIDRSTIVVGANFVNGAAGAAYIYTKPDEGTWPTSPTTTLADPGPGGDTFGESVAVDGPHLVVGADQGFGSGGTVYYFTRGPSGWPVTPTTTVADPAGTGADRFGFSVAVESNAVVAGAWFTLGTVGMAYILAP